MVENGNLEQNTNQARGKFMITLKYLSDFKITRHIKLKADANPYDTMWTEYFVTRTRNKMRAKFQWKKPLIDLWNRQKHRCAACGKRIGEDDLWSVVKINETSKIMTHKKCCYQTTLFGDFEPASKQKI
jgi:RNA-directed DNA polymerase